MISILVVDDEINIRRLLEYNLEREGFEVYLATNGIEGLEITHEKKPNLILLDWMMPKMNGMETLRNIKNDKQLEHIPVFMLTAKGTVVDVDQAFKVGADDYISKPFRIADFQKKLKRIT